MVNVRSDIAFRLYPSLPVAAQTMPAQPHPLVIVGGGPIGMALDVWRKGTQVLVLDDHEGAGPRCAD